ncbi:capsule assembly Wzi family protein [Bowmanella sp. JS7-9]|uniref:capsule assembly Wzi family protein n=1 Tax=Alteromonadaceae TaxID=72275 RepID=UPI0010E9D326|nr:capsule assembly Wzi family protein [Bowmanella sp. JS7-9]TBX20655.1 hypothetical protein TK45_14420 [Bowmanella sp. JS7-9]
MLSKRLMAILACTPSLAMATGVSPYLPLNISPEAELQIERAFVLAGHPSLSKPYKASDLLRILPQLRELNPTLYQQLSQYLSRYRRTEAVTHKSFTLATNDGPAQPLPNQRGQTSDSRFSVESTGFYMFSPYIALAAGTRWDEQQGLSHFGTHLSVGNEYLQLDAGYRDHWWSPMQDSALLLSTHAPNSLSVTLSNASPLSPLGLRYELFISELEDLTLSPEMGTQSHNLIGAHLSFQPLTNLNLGMNRVVHLGANNQAVGIGNTVQALLNTDAHSEPSSYALSSVSARYNHGGDLPVSVYTERARSENDDDSANSMSFGVFLPFVTKDIALRAEYVKQDRNWATPTFFQQGYSNDNLAIGHWADQPVEPSELRVTSVNLSWQHAGNRLLNVTLRNVSRHIDTDSGSKNHIQLEASYSFATSHGFYGISLYTGKNSWDQSFTRLSGFYRW